MRPGAGRRATAAALVLVVAVAAGCSSGGERSEGRSGSAGRSSTTSAPAGQVPASVLAATTVPGARAPGVSTTVPQDCGPLRAADVAAAAGVTEGEVQRGRADAPDEPCVFRAGPFEVATASALQESTTTVRPVPLPSVPGLPGHNYLSVQLDRSGRWNAQAGVLVGRTFVSLTVHNGRAGRDTYPPADGPPQEGPTRDLTVALLTVLAGRI